MFSLKNKKILAVGPHPDDLEIGCFGTLARLAAHNEIHCLIMTNGEVKDPQNIRKQEAQAAVNLIHAHLHWEGQIDGHITDCFQTVQIIEKKIQEIKPDLIFIINGKDTHQDHRYCHYAAVSATRKHPCVLVYESGSEMQFNPVIFVDITDFMDLKIKAIQCHKSQFPIDITEPCKGVAKAFAFRLHKPDRYFEGFEIIRGVI